MAIAAPMPDTKHVPQGSLELLETDVAQRLLATQIARIAYVAPDGTPRVFPTWFKWNDGELVTATMARSATGRRAGRLRALAANRAVAVTIDTDTAPWEVLLLRGEVEITEVDGVVPEYAWCVRRWWGEEAGGHVIAGLEEAGVRMARVTLRPSWVGLIDFRTRFPHQMEGEEVTLP